ncbi:RnfABCDGE type electron transport complex subunit D [bacterium]
MDVNQNYIVEVSPHIRSKETIPRIMLDVLIALIPALVVSIIIFGLRSLFIILISVFTCILSEHLFCRLTKRQCTVSNLSIVVTGILFAFVLPPGIPYYMVVVGAVFAVIIGKCVFGGLGHNPFNPALAGRAFLLASWPVAMTTWWKPFWFKQAVDTITTASPLGIVKMNLKMDIPHYWDLFIGVRAGCIGEVSVAALLAGVLYLLMRNVIKWYIPLSYILTVAVFSFVAGRDPVFNVMSGGLILGACFMATDYTTSPLLKISQIIFGIGCGLLTCFIRFWGGFPEGVCYSILIMNCATPILDQYIKPKRYGIKTSVRVE